MSALSNALSKLEEVKEGATIQLIIRPTGHRWRKMGRTISHRMQQGKQLKDVSYKTVAHELGKGVGREMSGMFFSAATKKEQPLEKQPVQLTPEEQDLIKAIGEKSAKTGFKVNIRLLASAPTQERADEILREAKLLASLNAPRSPTSTGSRAPRSRPASPLPSPSTARRDR